MNTLITLYDLHSHVLFSEKWNYSTSIHCISKYKVRKSSINYFFYWEFGGNYILLGLSERKKKIFVLNCISVIRY